MATENTTKMAVLIDAGNAQPAIAGALLAEVTKFGTAHVKRAYGDWTGTRLTGWKDQLLAQSIQPMQQFAYTRSLRRVLPASLCRRIISRQGCHQSASCCGSSGSPASHFRDRALAGPPRPAWTCPSR
jgi:hypothetical protein